MGAEKLRKVLSGGLATHFVEVEQALRTVLINRYVHWVSAQQFEQARVEAVVLARQVIVEPQLVVKVHLHTQRGMEKVAVGSVIYFEQINQCAVGHVRGGFTVEPNADV